MINNYKKSPEVTLDLRDEKSRYHPDYRKIYGHSPGSDKPSAMITGHAVAAYCKFCGSAPK